jgi:hypothetical protein
MVLMWINSGERRKAGVARDGGRHEFQNGSFDLAQSLSIAEGPLKEARRQRGTSS